MRLFRTHAALAAAFFICSSCTPPGPTAEVQFLEFKGDTMGTTYSVSVAHPPEPFVESPSDLAHIIEREL